MRPRGPERAGLLMPIHWGPFDFALHGWRQPIESLLEISVARKWPMFAPEPGLPTEVALVQSEWCAMLGSIQPLRIRAFTEFEPRKLPSGEITFVVTTKVIS